MDSPDGGRMYSMFAGGTPTLASVSSPLPSEVQSTYTDLPEGPLPDQMVPEDRNGRHDDDSDSLGDSSGNAHGFSFFTGLCFSVNMAMGTGFLTLPWAFAKAGLVVSAATVALTAFLGNLTKDYVLESMARAEAMRAREGTMSSLTAEDDRGDAKSKSMDEEENDLTVPLIELFHDPRDSLPAVGIRKYDMVQLCDLFLGTKGKIAFVLILSIFSYGTLWAFSSVFAGSMSSILPLDIVGLGAYYSYWVYLGIFSCFAVTLTCLELHEQITIQVCLSLARMAMVVLMIYTTMTAFNATKPVFGDQCGAVTTSLYNIKGLYIILPISMYCQIYHHAIPSLSQPVADKRQLGQMFSATFFICGCFYTLIGGTVGWYFGTTGHASSNLDWNDYHGNPGMPHWVVLIIKYYVVVFPALNVASSFPLYGIALANNLLAMYYGEKASKAEKEKALPPLIGAAIIRDLGAITNYTGMVAFLLCFVFPALLQWKSKEMYATHLGEADLQTAYSTPFTNATVSVPAVLAVGCALVVYTLTYNIITSLR